MNYQKTFRIPPPGARVPLKSFDPQFTDKHENQASALLKIEKLQQKVDKLQFASMPRRSARR